VTELGEAGAAGVPPDDRSGSGSGAPPARTSLADPEPTETPKSRWRDWRSRLSRYQLHLLAAYLVCAVTALIILRAQVDEVDFLGVGWIVTLAALPLLPWLFPRFVEFVKIVLPYVQSFKVGAIQLDLRSAQRIPMSIATAGMQPSLPNDASALSSGTSISSLVKTLRDLDRLGGSPIGIIDLQDGHKWRLPNVYFLARLLELEPVVRELVFTEMRAGMDGYLVGSAAPGDVRQRIEQAVPMYASAAAMLPPRDVPTLADANLAQPVGEDFQKFLGFLGPNPGDEVFGYVTSRRLAEVAGPLSDAAVEGLSTSLSEEQLRTAVQSLHRFVPVTTAGRVTGIIDRDAVALAVARSALTQS
jgi:hypothetical protein